MNAPTLKVITLPSATESRPRLSHRAADRLTSYVLASTLMAAVLAFGAVEPWSVFALKSVAILLAAAWLGNRVWAGDISLLSHPLFIPGGLLLVAAVTQCLFGLTVYGNTTQHQTTLLAALLALFFLSSQLYKSESLVSRFLLVMAGGGFVIAVFAIVQSYTSAGTIYWLRHPQYAASIFGPYVNRNHYAGLMEMLFPIPLLLGMDRRMATERRLLLMFLSAVMLVSIFLSLSRGGFIAVCVQAVFLFIVLSARSERGQKVPLIAGTLVVCLLVMWLADHTLVERLLTLRDPLSDETSGNRLVILKDGLRIVRDHLFWGTGLGTFPTIYPAYRSFYSESFVNAAHNDYLQLIVEMGVAGWIALVWFLAIVVRRGRELLRGWKLDTMKRYRLACFAGIVGLLVHGALDFNLQVPANAALFAVLVGIATGNGSTARERNMAAWTPRD